MLGSLAVWGVGGEEGEGGGGGRGEGGPPTVSLQSELELDAGIFSLSFDHNMKLVGLSSTPHAHRITHQSPLLT